MNRRLSGWGIDDDVDDEKEEEEDDDDEEEEDEERMEMGMIIEGKSMPQEMCTERV